MDEIREVKLAIPLDTTMLGIFYIREIEKDGYYYNSADSRTFMMPGIDGIDLVMNTTYKIDENGNWVEATSDLQLSQEELESRELLEKELESEDK